MHLVHHQELILLRKTVFTFFVPKTGSVSKQPHARKKFKKVGFAIFLFFYAFLFFTILKY
ncbi:hypothetical protein BpHYR1_052542 [Brachionus plicatilis]|uniref:Uncharacterized protein n=1 Tax=Brachionus plicatilis TaxID=10195 RepID=A0A3M7RX87_BRAPC|nr:hypothetical protein BpHYR1_052542 [Brachionus plicatilis]